MTYRSPLLATGGILLAAAIAGCPQGGPQITPSPGQSAAPSSPAPLARTTTQNLVFQSMIFRTAPAGAHEVIVKNLTGADITDLANYVLAFYPRGTSPVGAMATSSIVDNSGTALTSLANNGSLRVYLYSTATPSVGTEAKASWPIDTVQYGAGGELGLFKAAATSSANITDYLRWGTASVSIEPVAVEAKLWTTGATIATVSVPNTAGGAISTTKVQGGIGATNWTPFVVF